MAQMLKNSFVKARNGLDFSRSIFSYEKRHSTNLLAGYITPVFNEFLYPGMSPDLDFGCVIESAPLIATNLDNIYVDIVCIWSPIRLVMPEWNEFLGESHTTAFTINRNITIPKTPFVSHRLNGVDNGASYIAETSRAYWAEHFLAGHLGFRYHGVFDNTVSTTVTSESIFYKGISVLPSRIYENNWNVFFRNENVQAPILISKTPYFDQYNRDGSYKEGLGRLQLANKLKNFYTVATPAPSLLDVSLALGEFMPVGFNSSSSFTVTSGTFLPTAGDTVISGFNQLQRTFNSSTTSYNFVADLSALTVNKMYYALMEQRFANKLIKGRRAVEFYQNFFGIQSSEAGHDLPQLICQKRYPLNISQVIATANSTDIQNNDQPLGSRGAYSVTGFNGSMIKQFMATEHGYLQTYMIIRGQPSLATGIDHHLGYDTLLDTYLPEFDHIGPVGIDVLEVGEPSFVGGAQDINFGFTNAWYFVRKQVSDVVGIMEPTEPLAYKTLALSYQPTGNMVISDSFLRFNPKIIDRIFLFPVLGLGTPNAKVDPTDTDTYAVRYDSDGEPTDSNRYQFLTQFVVKGKLAAVMSPDSEPLQLRL